MNKQIKDILSICIICVLCASTLYAATMEDGINALNAGQLQVAQGIFEEISKISTEPVLTRAIAYKNLGTVLFRLGKPSQEPFDIADSLFLGMLKKNDSSEIKKQYGYMLYQRANCLLTDCENQLSKAKIQGIFAIPFDYFKKYISPAMAYMNKAKQFYPQKQQGDILLLELDLLLCETHVWVACHQNDSADRSRNKVLNLLDTGLRDLPLAADTKKKLLLRKVILMCESAQKSENIVLNTLNEAVKMESANVELDISVFTFYAKYILTHKSSFTSEEYTDLEKQIKASIAKIEELREQNLKSMDFVSRKSYFATRTELYEVLLMLYAKQNRPFNMLLAINHVRSRAIQDDIDVEKIKSLQCLQDILTDNQGMLLAYYVGSDHVWSVCFTGADAEIAVSKHSGQELVAICRTVIDVYSNIEYAKAAWRYGYRCKAVSDVFEMSHSVYNDIFLSFHHKFIKNHLKHLYIIQHNILNYLPFSALATKTNPEDIFKTRFVADEGIPISYLTSVNSLLVQEIPHSTENKNIVFARGDYSFPAFYNKDPENPDNPNASPLNLPNVQKEGKTVAKLLKVSDENLLVEKNASEFNFIQKTTGGSAIIHIASHAHLNVTSPLDSYVVLAAGHGYDGKVKVNELLTKYRGKIHADLLVLSSCNTNRGENNIMPGDDIAALSNAFLVAGVKNVIATEWPAFDSSFPEIMEQFYSRLMGGISKDVALAQAIKAFISKKDHPVMRYPVFWGNIVLNGRLQK